MRVRAHGLRKHGACAVHSTMHALFFPSLCPAASHSSALQQAVANVWMEFRLTGCNNAIGSTNGTCRDRDETHSKNETHKRKDPMHKLKLIASIVTLLLTTLAPAHAAHVWIESEAPAEMPELASLGNWGKPEFVSDQLLMLMFVNKDADKMPEEGITIRYSFEAPEAETYELWNRVVFSGIRAPFRWRINGGDWTANSQGEQPIRNIRELGRWNPLGWTPMGKAELKEGPNSLEIFIERGFMGQKEIRYVSDAMLATTEPFQPNFKYKPGDTTWRDEKAERAAANVFALPVDEAGQARTEITLSGLWQYAPYDEGKVTEVDRKKPVEAYPPVERLNWYGIDIPNNRNSQYWDHRYCHRYVLRTFVDVPEDYDDDSAYLLFEAVSLINTLFVNGEKVDDFSIHYGQWQADISGHLKAGQKNEILVVVKDGFYALRESAQKGTVSDFYYAPWSDWGRSQGFTMRLDFPIKGNDRTGLFDEVKLATMDGPVYIADVYVNPFPITQKDVEFEVVLHNPTGSRQDVTIKGDVDRLGNEGAEDIVSLGATAAQVPANGQTTVTIRIPSEKLDLWWPTRPTLHDVDLTVSTGNKVVDACSERFGNREWEIRGNQFYINGMRKHLRTNAMHGGTRAGSSAEAALADWREAGINMFRRRFQWSWHHLKSPRELLG